MARMSSTCTPCLRMMLIDSCARPSVFDGSGERFNVQLMNRARRSSNIAGTLRAAVMARTGFTDMIGTVLRSAGQSKPKGVDAAFSISDLRRMAEKRLPKGPFGYMDGAAEDEVALRRNSEGFADYRLVGRTLRDVSEIDTSHTILGTPSSLPIFLSPTGFGRLFHHEGERASARAAEKAGLIFTLSTLGTVSIEDVAAVSQGPKWFQLYVWKDRSIASDLIARARSSGYETLVLTVDP